MGKSENRDFNTYYGISKLRNPFTTSIADECNADVIYKPILPQAVIKPDHSASSFMVLAKFGTGKTLLRCQYNKTLSSDHYFKILILNKQTDEYLERFVSKTGSAGKNCKTPDCLEGWTKIEFAQMILSLLVTQFVDAVYQERLILPSITLDEKFYLLMIICHYYNEQGATKLENFINSFLMKTGKSMYSLLTAKPQIKEGNKSVDKPLLTKFKRDLHEMNAIRQDYKKLILLVSIAENEGFQSESTTKNMPENVLNDLTYFTQFMKNYMNRPVVYIVDSIDENQYFFHENTVLKRSLELFCRSVISQEVLSSVMAQNFYLSLFYPDIMGINIQDAIFRNDKFPVYKITWNSKALIDYTDYNLAEMNKQASRTSRCKPLPDFKTLVNYNTAPINDIINEIETPRELHYFFAELIGEMNNSPNTGKKPFIATYENVKVASKKAKDLVFKRMNIQ